jgi:tetratricopeptide (TPR) repeat protein
MRTLALVLVVFAALSGHARADQNDPRLDPLFAELKLAATPSDGARIVHRIWALWFESKNPAVKALLRRGQAHLRASRYGEAAAAFDQVVKVAPGFGEGWNRRATARYLLGDYAGSLRDIERTLKLEPRHFGALSGRGLVYSKMGRNRAALAAFKAALAINPHLPAARLNIRILRKKLGDKAI